ncbi:PREDICTED: uncharacterized protein LOC109217722 [Nicotiana attenuata]|uniref:uncharacterized protein LOC109217722 n=1 Tax=Nicotiana attenuata TaxID=49451 RepID=UPI0009059970|nr:PREDICTED: uncharacterized protein LOC109217722 [Nicotiana attenuata]
MSISKKPRGKAGTSSVGGETVENASSTAAGGSASAAAAGSASEAAAGSAATAGSATAPLTMESGTFTQPITDPSTQQSTNVARGPKRKTNEPRKGGANAGSKRPKVAEYGVLFDSSGIVIQRFGTTIRVAHNPSTLISSAPTNIELRFKPPGLKWKGRSAVTQRQLQEQSYRRANSATTTQATPVTQSTPSNQTQQTLFEVLS